MVTGAGTITQAGNSVTINQTSQNLSINWLSFGVGANQSVIFSQPNSSAIALNRVLGIEPSSILGTLSANGQVWILNPNGILFGSGSQVNVGGLVASTLQISDADFVAGKRTFTGSGGIVTNQGSLAAAEGGYIVLLGGQVSNEGTIQARLGTVGLGAGTQVALDFAGDRLLNLQVEKGYVNALAQNRQIIQADGGAVIMTAKAADALMNAVVNNEGVIEARTIDAQGGTIRLLGDGGAVEVAGTLDASAPNGGNGGTIETVGQRVNVADSVSISTAAPQGLTGRWQIESADFTIAASGGQMSGATLARQLANTNVAVISNGGASGANGDITVDDAVSWSSGNSLVLSAQRNVDINQTIANLGAGGMSIRADNTGLCTSGSGVCGTVSFGAAGHLAANGGSIDLYYNPVASSTSVGTGSGPTYSIPTDFSSNVTLNGGSSLTSWMLVNDIYQLQAMGTNLGGNYALGKDIAASSTAGWSSGAGFIPIGTLANAFNGRLDGLGHSITDLVISRPGSEGVGLFGAIGSGGAISNLALSGGSVIGSSQVGGLVGYNAGTLRDVSSTAAVSGASGGASSFNYYIGGLVGYNAGMVDRANAGGTVNGAGYYSYYVGGLVGRNVGTVANSAATGDVNGHVYVGGLAGENAGVIANADSTGAVTGFQYVGGLSGLNSGAVTDSGSRGDITAYQYFGGLIGQNYGEVSNSHYNIDRVSINNGHLVSVGGIFDTQYQDWSTHGKTLDISNYAATLPFDSQSGYYLVGSVQSLKDLLGFADKAGYRFRQTADIDLSGAAPGFFIPHFAASEFDGAGHSLSNLNVVQSQDNVGMFGYLGTNSIVRNVVLSNAVANGIANVGGLVGYNAGSVSNVRSAGSVSGNSAVGGLVGNNSGTVADAASSGQVNGDSSVGGLVGHNAGTVSNASSSGSVGGDSAAGGLVGYNAGTVGNTSSSATVYASVIGANAIGGLVGYNAGAIADSKASGTVIGGAGYYNFYVGGLVGNNAGTIVNSSSSGFVSGGDSLTNYFVGGLVGYNGGMLSNGYSSGAVVGGGTVSYYIGGLAGYNSGTVVDSTSSGTVSGGQYVGGLIGFNDGTIVNSTGSGAATGEISVGSQVGQNAGTVIDPGATQNGGI